MFRHYFRISTRMLLRHKFYTFINILGLAVGMGICLLIYQYIHFELSFDQFHANADHMYRLTQTTYRNGEDEGTGVYTTYALGPESKETIPGITDFVRVRTQAEGPVIINPENHKRFLENEIWYVDSSFLQMFDFPLRYGDRNTALDEKHSVVITEKMANKYFGDVNPIGKDLRVSLGGLSGDYIVTGVLEKLPVNSHLQFDFLLPMKFILETYRFYSKSDSEGWGLADFVTYVKLDKAANPKEVEEKLDQLVATHAIGDAENEHTEWKIKLQPLTDVHLKSKFQRDLASHPGDIQHVRFFSIIAVFILLMAWINYINLATARAMNRAKEVGVRKTIGALRNQLISQFMIESALINCMAATFSIGIAFFTLPLLNHIIGTEIPFSVLQSLQFWVLFGFVILIGSLLSGLYPAFILSSFQPISVLKSVKVTPKSGLSMRRSLITFQFLMSVLLISGTYLVYQQITYMKKQDLGIDMEKILVLSGPRVFLETLKEEGVTEESKQQLFINQVTVHHAISSVTLSSSIPGKGYYYTESFRKAGAPEVTDKTASYVLVDTSLAETYGMEYLAKAPSFRLSDHSEQAIVNEETIKEFNLGSPEKGIA